MTTSGYPRRYPPVLCRLLARHQRRQGANYIERPMSARELAARSGLSIQAVELLSSQTSWEDTPFGMMLRFAQACGCDFDDPAQMRRQRDIVRNSRGRMRHWRDDPRLSRLAEIWVRMPAAA